MHFAASRVVGYAFLKISLYLHRVGAGIDARAEREEEEICKTT
jgi:hypothetical protein